MVLCKNKLAIIKNNGQDLIKTGDAFTVTSDGSKKESADNKKQIIRCFNAKCDNLLVNLSVKNIDTARSKISKSFESLNKIFSVDGISLRSKLLELNREELNRVYIYALKKSKNESRKKKRKQSWNAKPTLVLALYMLFQYWFFWRGHLQNRNDSKA